jgi:hypothetical protein
VRVLVYKQSDYAVRLSFCLTTKGVSEGKREKKKSERRSLAAVSSSSLVLSLYRFFLYIIWSSVE